MTAFANSAGGQIVYGISEKGASLEIDAGIDSRQMTTEWISQVIDTNSSPRVQGLSIQKIVLDAANPSLVAYVLSIPAATSFAPHQNAIDKRYYRRFESRSVPMHDYEIRDLLRRGQYPQLLAKFTFADGGVTAGHNHPNQKFDICPVVENVSSRAALYSLFDFTIDKRLTLVNDGGFKRATDLILDNYVLHKLQKMMLAPPDFPLVRGANMTFGPPNICIQIPDRYYGRDEHFLIGYSALTEGFGQSRYAPLILARNVLTISEFVVTYETKVSVMQGPRAKG